MTNFKYTINVKTTNLEIKKALIKRAEEIGCERHDFMQI